MKRYRWLAVALASIGSALVVVPPVVSPMPVSAQAGGGLSASKSAPGTVLAGESVSYTTSATNTGAVALFNVSFRDELPLGVEYVGPTTPSDIGEPEIVVNQVPDPDPAAAPGATIPQQTLIWSNVADLQVGSSLEFSFSVQLNEVADPDRPSLPVYQVGSTVQNSSTAFASPNERVVPRFDAAGVPITDPNVTSATTATTNTLLTAIQVDKSEPSPEGELLRGVQTESTVYSLRIRTTDLNAVTGAVVTDYLPAQLEFLGCGGVDNSTVGVGTNPEYPGAPSLDVTPVPPDCRVPASVETVENPPADGTTVYPPGVYTKVTWNLTAADTVAGADIVLRYAAGIPLRANVPFPAGTPLDGVQTANLDNNTGPSTRETATEQAVTNVARVSGVYTGTVAPGASQNVFDDDRVTRTVEDVRIRKTFTQPADGLFRTGAIAVYQITIDTSQYVDASGLVLTDVIPNGLCPLSNVAYPATGLDNCGQALGSGNPNLPSVPFASVTPVAGGGFRVVFDPIPAGQTAAGDTVVVTYRALMRQNYELGSLDGRPTVSGDTFTNVVASTASTTPIPDSPETGTETVNDGSSATLVSTGSSIDKRILPRGAPVPPGTPCPDPTGTNYIDADTVAPNVAFRLGDEVCFSLRMDFDPALRSRNVVVTDFLPAGVEYVAGSIRTTANNLRVNPNFGDATLTAEGPLVLNLGDTDPLIGGTDRFVDLGAVMEVVFKAVIVDVPDNNTPTITGNLMKVRSVDSAGNARSYRDRVALAIVPAPPMELLKGVAAVDTPAFSTTLPNQDDRLVQQGSRVTFRIDLTNLGTAANFNAYSTRGFDVWDVLPDRIRCADVVPGSPTAFGETGLGAPIVSCTNPGDVGHPTFAGNTARSAIRWNLATDPTGPGGVDRWTIGAGDSATLTYQLIIPTPTSIGVNFVNTAALRSFEAFTNQTNTSATYFPANNIDTTVTPEQQNAPAATDPSNVRTPGARTTKTGTTSIEESNNDRPRVAVPGELITYTIAVEIPPAVSVFEAQLRDILPTQLEIVAPSPVANFYPDASTSTTAAFPAPGFGPNGFVLDAATGTLTFPRNPNPALDTGYSNNTTTTQRFEVVLTARVRPTVGNQTTITNRAQFQSVNRPGGQPVSTPDSTFANDIRQANPSVVKSNNSGGTVRAGAVVRYTLSGRNTSGRPPAHDSVVRDCIPAGLTFVAFDPATPAGTTSGPAAGNPATNGCPTGTTFISFSIGTVLAGAQVNRSYTAQVESTAVGGNTYTNTAAITASSLDNGVNDSTVERVYTPAQVTNTVTVPGAGTTKTVTPTEATIGEVLTYTVVGAIPRDINFYQAALRDLIPLGLDVSTIQLIDSVCESIPNTDTPAPPGCAAPATLLTPEVLTTGILTGFVLGDQLAVPYDRVVTIRYSARIADIAPNIAGAIVTNRAQTVWDNVDLPTNPTTPSYPWTNQGTIVDADTLVTEPSLTVVKTVSDETPEPGEVFTYTIEVTNATGANVSDAHNITIVDDLPLGVIVEPSSISPAPTAFTNATDVSPGTIEWGPGGLLAGPLAPGDTLTLSYEAQFVASTLLAGGPKLNIADIDTYEGLPVSEPAGTNRRVYEGPQDDASVTPDFPRLSTTKTAVDGEPTYIGDAYTWRITTRNTGAGTAFGVSVDDVLPPNWVYVANSAVVTFPGGTTASREPDTGAPDCTDADLCWNGLGNLLPGQSVVVEYDARPLDGVVATPGVGSAIRHINTASSDGADRTGATRSLDGPYGSDPATASTRIDAADLVIDKSSPATPPPIAGRDFSWTIDVSNKSGVDTAVGPFVVTDTLPVAPPGFTGDWVTFASASGTGWTCAPASGAPTATIVSCNRSNPSDVLAPGAAFPPITVRVTLPATLPLGTTLRNDASVTSRTYELTPADNADFDEVTTATSADLRIVKNRTEPAIVAGSTTSYTLDVTNLGPSVSRAPIVVRDPLPAGTSFVSSSGPGWSPCGLGTGADANVVICTYTADLAVGEVAPQITLTVEVASDATGMLTNTATVTGTTFDPNPDNNTSTNEGPITQSADLRIDKQNIAPDPGVGGLPTQYLLRVDNDGPSDAVDLVISDVLPAGLTFVSADSVRPDEPSGWVCVGANGNQTFNCSLPRLAAGDFASVIVTVALDPGLTGDVLNTATVTSPTPDPDPDNNTDDDLTSILGEADLQIIKTASPDPVAAGENVTYTLQVTNNGPSDSVGPIVVRDTLPTGLEFVSAGGGTGADAWNCPTPTTATVVCTRSTTLPASTVGGANVAPPIELVVRIVPSRGPGQIVNVASVIGTTTDPNPGNNSDDVAITVVDLAELTILKETTGPDPVLAGESTAFTITVTNDGPSTADSLVVTDTLPAGLLATAATGTGWTCAIDAGRVVTCERPVLDPGAAPPIVIDVSVDVGVPNNTLITNVASVDSATPELPVTDPGSLPNTSSDTVLVLAEADLAITKSHTGPVRIGGPLTFTFDVVNNGPSASRAVVVSDTFPVGLTPQTATGDGWTCTVVGQQVDCALGALLGFPGQAQITVTALVGPEAFPQVDNTATVSAETADPVPENNSSTDTVIVPPLVDLTITKTHAAPVTVGEPIIYTLVVGNDGPIDDPATITVTDTLPDSLTPISATSTDADTSCAISGQEITCTTLGGLVVGDTVEIEISATVLPSAYPSVVNTARVSTPTDDVDLTNNVATDEAVVPPLVDLSITKTHRGPVQVGGSLVYTIVTTNNGPTPEPGPIVIADPLPIGLTPTSASGSGLDCSISGPNVRCTSIAPLGVGESLTLTIVADVGAAAFPSVTNVATVTSPGCEEGGTGCRETDLTNNRATDVAQVAPLILLDLTKALASQDGSNATWEFTVRNAGLNATVDPIVLTDALPAGLVFASASGDGWACSNAVNVVTCTYPAVVQPGASAAPLRLQTLIVASAGTEIVNVATVTGGGPSVPAVSDDAIVTAPAASLPDSGGGPSILLQWAPFTILLGLALVLLANRRRNPAAMY